ncbi:MAG TPA: methylenetetrahydrofolate reductase [Bdellovibrionota bacterium]|jgi:homocysteine S-methyltransferase
MNHKPEAHFRQRLLEKLSSPQYRFVTVEVGMPQGHKSRGVRDGCFLLGQKGCDALNLADNPNARVKMHPLAFQSRLLQAGPAFMDTIYHITCRDKNMIALQTEILGAAALNIAAVLAVTGDAVKKGPEPAKSVFEGNSLRLLEMVLKMREGKLMSGEDLEEPVDMLVGVAYNPNAENIDNETERLLRKIEAGADFAETQPVHSKDAFDRCVEALVRYNIPQERFPVIFGLMPVMSRKNGEFLNAHFSGIKVPESVLVEFDAYTKREDREKLAYEQALELAMHFSKDGTNNYYIICPFSRYELVSKIVEYVKFGYSHVEFSDNKYLKQDMSRQVETPDRIKAIVPGPRRSS